MSVAPLRLDSISGNDTRSLEVLVNAIREAYLREVVEKNRSVRRQRLGTLSELIAKYEEQLKGAREAQKEITGDLGTKNTEVRARMLAFLQRRLTSIEDELLSAHSQLRKARVELELLQPEKPVRAAKKSGEDVSEASNKDLAIRETRIDIRRQETRIAILEPETEQLRARISDFASKGIKLDTFREDLSHLEDMTKRLKAEHEALNVELQAPSRVDVLEKATVTRVSPARQWALTGAAGLAAVCFALLGFTTLFRRQHPG